MADRIDIQFLPLELWRASALAQETKTIIAAYERCLATGDGQGLVSLRRAIEKRVDALEAFYVSHVEDERSVLFEKQRLRLRKLLAEYEGIGPGASAYGDASGPVAAAPGPSALGAIGGGGSGAYGAYGSAGAAAGPYGAPERPYGGAAAAPSYASAGPSSGSAAHAGYAGAAASGAAAGGVTVTKEIREDTRLNITELMAWFTQAGVAEMPEVPPEVVERVFASVTRTNTDGRLSVRDLRQWYITFGKRAMREGIGADEIVSVAFVRSSGAAAVTARKEALLHERKRGVVDMIAAGTLPAGFAAGGGTAGGAAERGLGASGVGGAAATGSPSAGRGVAGLPGLHGEAGGAALPAGPLTLPNGMLEFQVRLTPEEFAQVALARRKLEAEAKYKARIAVAKVRQAALKADRWATGASMAGGEGGEGGPSGSGGGVGAAGRAGAPVLEAYPATSLLNLGPYEEPNAKSSYFYRSP